MCIYAIKFNVTYSKIWESSLLFCVFITKPPRNCMVEAGSFNIFDRLPFLNCLLPLPLTLLRLNTFQFSMWYFCLRTGKLQARYSYLCCWKEGVVWVSNLGRVYCACESMSPVVKYSEHCIWIDTWWLVNVRRTVKNNVITDNEIRQRQRKWKTSLFWSSVDYIKI